MKVSKKQVVVEIMRLANWDFLKEEDNELEFKKDYLRHKIHIEEEIEDIFSFAISEIEIAAFSKGRDSIIKKMKDTFKI